MRPIVRILPKHSFPQRKIAWTERFLPTYYHFLPTFAPLTWWSPFRENCCGFTVELLSRGGRSFIHGGPCLDS
jgi:hypothetical protein